MTDTDKRPLARCPFCGSDEIISVWNSDGAIPDSGYWSCSCDQCNTVEFAGDDRRAAESQWNGRSMVAAAETLKDEARSLERWEEYFTTTTCPVCNRLAYQDHVAPAEECSWRSRGKFCEMIRERVEGAMEAQHFLLGELGNPDSSAHSPIQQLRNDVEMQRHLLEEWRNREAAVCPEDYSFEDVLEAKDKRIAELESKLNETLRRYGS